MRFASNKASEQRSSTKAQQAPQQTVSQSQAQQSTVASQHQQDAATSNTGVPPQTYPLQARSSNSGTSLKRSDNVSQSSYPAGDISSDKAFKGFAKKGQPGSLQLVPGQLTTAFQQAMSNRTTPIANATAINKESGNAASSKRGNQNNRKSIGVSSTPTGIQSMQVSNSSSGTGISTRASGRVTRGNELRAVKLDTVSGAYHQMGATPKALPSSKMNGAESLLKVVKSTQSESGTMRTTRSKAKAKAPDSAMSEHSTDPKNASQTPRGQVSNRQTVEMNGNIENLATVSSILRPLNKPEQEPNCSWQAEEGKQASPKSQMSALIGLGCDKVGNVSFPINDSIESLIENPLTTVIKQFQNLRQNAQLTGAEKPTIQQFLEKFEKEMQFCEDQYQAQQQAREEQMKLFEQQYGIKSSNDAMGKLAGQSFTGTGLNDQQMGLDLMAPSHCQNDTLMVQDTSTLGHIALDQSLNSFNSAVHGPNNMVGSVFGGASELTSNEVYESFQFSQNSMLNFYPRQVRKILTRRKTTSAANATLCDLKELKPPKHRAKVAKNMQKMRGLAVCQMNMMQLLLQKISRRSKAIHKQEKIVNDNLKRKRIYLEKEKFDLMTVLRKGMDMQETKGSQQASVAAKSKARTASDLNSRCTSTQGTKSALEMPHGNKETTAGQIFGEDNMSMEGLDSRKQTQMVSSGQNCYSQAEEASNLHTMTMPQAPTGHHAAQTPEPPSEKVIGQQSDRLQRAEEQMKQAVHLSEIDDSFLKVSKHTKQHNNNHQQNSHQQVVPLHGDDFASYVPMNTGEPQNGEGLYSHIQMDNDEFQFPDSTPAKTMHQDSAFQADHGRHQSQTPNCAQTQYHLETQVIQEPNTGTAMEAKAQAAPLVTRKMQSTQGRRNKRKPALAALESEGASGAQNLLSKLDGETGSFAIADLTTSGQQQQQQMPHLQTQIALTLKAQDQSASEQKASNQTNASKAKQSQPKKKRTTKADTQQKMDSNVNSDYQIGAHEQILQPSEVQAEIAQNKDFHQQKEENQRKLSPFQELGHESNHHQENATNVQPLVQHSALYHAQTMPPMTHIPMMDASLFTGYPMMNEGMDMQPEHFLMGAPVAHPSRQAVCHNFNEYIKTTGDTQHVSGNVDQPMVDNFAAALHRSQSVLMPQSHHQMFGHFDNGVVSNEYAGVLPGYDNYNQMPQHVNQASVTTSNKATAQIIDPFFDESAQELSSIEQSQVGHIDNYASQLGFNPYEQAKRQALKNQGRDAADQSAKVQQQAVAGHYISPMNVHHTPSNKQDGGQQVGSMIHGGETPSHFMGGVETVGVTAGLGRGSVMANHHLGLASHVDQGQLSVSRIYGNDHLGMSGGYHGGDRQDSSAAAPSITQGGHALSAMRGAYGNTPNALMSNGQQCIADSHRQHLSVSGWNLEDPHGQGQANQGLPNSFM